MRCRGTVGPEMCDCVFSKKSNKCASKLVVVSYSFGGSFLEKRVQSQGVI